MSATPEQIAERLSTIDGYLNSLWDRAAKLRDQNTGQAHADLNELRHGIGAIPDGLLEAAALIRAQAERVRVLEEALRGLTDAYCALLLMKGEDPSRFKEPGSPYAKADAALRGEA